MSYRDETGTYVDAKIVTLLAGGGIAETGVLNDDGEGLVVFQCTKDFDGKANKLHVGQRVRLRMDFASGLHVYTLVA